MGHLHRFGLACLVVSGLLGACASPQRSPRDGEPTEDARVARDDVAARFDRAVADGPDAVADITHVTDARGAVDVAREVVDEAPERVDVPSAPDVDFGAPIRAVVTAAPAHSFGYGTATAVAEWFPGGRAGAAADVFNCPVGVGPESYTIAGPALPVTTYVYVVAWDYVFGDAQGVLGRVSRGGAARLSGEPGWQVCAMGDDHSHSAAGPSHGDVNADVARCNGGLGEPGRSSLGWVDVDGAVTPGAVGSLAVGEPNDGHDGLFAPVCPASSGGIDEAARWMWYQPGGVKDPFRYRADRAMRSYLIFRLALRDVAP